MWSLWDDRFRARGIQHHKVSEHVSLDSTATSTYTRPNFTLRKMTWDLVSSRVDLHGYLSVSILPHI